MSKKVQIMVWKTDGSNEPEIWYRLDDSSDAKRFFKNLFDNAEMDGREQFQIKEVTVQEWNDCVLNGSDQ